MPVREDGFVTAADAATGKTLWQAPTQSVIPFTLAAQGGRVFFHTGSELVALKLDTGQQLWRIAFPLLRRTTLFVTTIAFIGAFQTVDHIFVLTQGGPSRASTVLLYYLWEERFQNLNVGRASALTVVLVAVLLFFTITNFILGEEREDSYAR